MPPQPKIIFHDIPSTIGQTWSPYTTRTLLTLHHLHLPYTHNLIAYPDIAFTLQNLNVAPWNRDRAVKWHLPAVTLKYPLIKDANGEMRPSGAVKLGGEETLMESNHIAAVLATFADTDVAETLFPPGVEHENALQEMEQAIGRARTVLLKHLLPFVPGILEQRCKEYFIETRGKIHGDLEGIKKEALEIEKEEGALGRLVGKAMGPWVEVYRRFDGDGKGKEGIVDTKGDFFFGRETPSYVDYCFVALIHWWLCVRGEYRDVILDAVSGVEGGRLGRVFRGCEHLLRAEAKKS